jgi:8-oxo-dGTP pyrophosphatase MutT (NUDIX family)
VAEVAAAVAALDTRDDGPDFPDARPSAVLVALADGPEGAEVLLTRRSMHLSNHRGEVSFPGGRLDPGETFEAGALREAHEEVGLDPELVTLVGRLHPISTWVSRSYIVPVVGRISTPVALEGMTSEVDRVLWSISGMGERPIFFFELDDETVWGATARMMHQLLRVVHGVEWDDAQEPPAI